MYLSDIVESAGRAFLLFKNLGMEWLANLKLSLTWLMKGLQCELLDSDCNGYEYRMGILFNIGESYTKSPVERNKGCKTVGIICKA